MIVTTASDVSSGRAWVSFRMSSSDTQAPPSSRVDGDDDDDDDVDFLGLPPSDERPKKGNPGLQAVIDQGLGHLKTTSTIIQSKKESKKPLFHKAAIEEQGPTKKQLVEANRVLSVATRCLEEMHKKKKTHNMLSIGGHSILLLHVQVNTNLREATVYWALPFEILLEADEQTRLALTEKMQEKLTQGGGGKFLQYEVHRALSSYYPPKLKFKPANDVLLQQMLDI